MDELIPISYACAYCGEENETFVDPSGGTQQMYTEDCTVCCRPNVLTVRISGDDEVSLDVSFEG